MCDGSAVLLITQDHRAAALFCGASAAHQQPRSFVALQLPTSNRARTIEAAKKLRRLLVGS
jgi:hypothetical protein